MSEEILMLSINVRWFTRNPKGAFEPHIPHDGRLIYIISGYHVAGEDAWQMQDRGVIIEGDRFTVVDLSDLMIGEPG